MNVNKYLVPITKDQANKLVLFANDVGGTNGVIDYAIQHGYNKNSVVDQAKQFKKFASDVIAHTNTKKIYDGEVKNIMNQDEVTKNWN